MNILPGLKLVQLRGEAMQRASEEVPSGLMIVFFQASSKLGLAMDTAKQYCSKRLGMEHPVCQTANFLYPEVKVIGGNTEVC
jgi:[acyl-carrier-protein] S-malonyltransferase